MDLILDGSLVLTLTLVPDGQLQEWLFMQEVMEIVANANMLMESSFRIN